MSSIPLNLFLAHEALLILLGCLIQPQYEGYFFSFHILFVIFGFCLLEACSFLRGNGKGNGSGEWGDNGKLGGVD